MNDIKLTRFSPGAGCGCKISPAVLSEIFSHVPQAFRTDRLLVGYESRDDAAVLDIGGGRALISTTDFFTPIVDDPFDFGRIAAANALSDIYAMGGSPLMAISILGWPVEKLSPETASQVIEGAQQVCIEAGIPLAGGHSIDIQDPVFGLAVTGMAETGHIKRNDTAKKGDRLYLSKPLGIGILSTATKKGLLKEEDYKVSVKWMTRLNKAGEELGQMPQVRAMTDVTGFGLLGHLIELCEGSGTGAKVDFDRVPVIGSLQPYIDQKCIPGGTHRNWKSYGHKVSAVTEQQKLILADPQTSGGLLVAVDPHDAGRLSRFLAKNGFVEIGILEEPGSGALIEVI